MKLTEILSKMRYHLYVNVHEVTPTTALIQFNGIHKCNKLSLDKIIKQNKSLICVILRKIRYYFRFICNYMWAVYSIFL